MNIKLVEQKSYKHVAPPSDLTIGGFLNPTSSLFNGGSKHGQQVAWALEDQRSDDQKLLNLSASMAQGLSEDRVAQLEQQIELERQARTRAESRAQQAACQVSTIENRLQQVIERNKYLEMENAKILKEYDISKHYVEKLRAKLLDNKELQQKFAAAELALRNERDLRKAIEQQVVDPVLIN